MKLATTQELKDKYTTHEWFGGYYGAGIELKAPQIKIEPANALYLLNKKYGKYNNSKVDDYKSSFEYVFKSEKHPDVYFTIYDYKSYISAGFGIPTMLKKNLSKKIASELNAEIAEVLAELFEKTRHYDGYIDIDGYNDSYAD